MLNSFFKIVFLPSLSFSQWSLFTKVFLEFPSYQSQNSKQALPRNCLKLWKQPSNSQKEKNLFYPNQMRHSNVDIQKTLWTPIWCNFYFWIHAFAYNLLASFQSDWFCVSYHLRSLPLVFTTRFLVSLLRTK